MSDQPVTEQSAQSASPPFRPGMELAEPISFTPPQVRPDAPVWQPYRPPSLSRRSRVACSAVVLFLPAFWLFALVLQLVATDGPFRAGFAVFAMPLVAGIPLAIWALRDLWGKHH